MPWAIMAHPLKHFQVDGRTIGCVAWSRATGHYYIIDS